MNRTLTLAGAVVLLVSGCGSESAAGTSLEDLRDSTESCPIDLPAAATDAGLSTEGGTAVAVSSGEPGSPLESAGGVHVTCEVALEDGHLLEAALLAVETGTAGTLLAPLVTQDAGLGSDDVTALVAAIADAAAGTTVDVPGSAPVSLAVVDVADAESAALVVSASGGADRAAVDAVTEALVAELQG